MTRAAAETLLDVDSLSVEIGGTPILRDVSLSLGTGEAMGLVGESGSGKSMTLKAVLGMLPPGAKITGGTIRFRGEEVYTGSRKRYMSKIRGAGISMVFQEPAIALNPVMKVGHQISDAVAERKGLKKAEAHALAVDLMEQVGIVDPENRASSYPFELSGGMRQRVMIAAALAQEPELLLCDEPTTALDVTVQAQVLDIFRRLQRERHLGLLYVTHDLAVVSQLCTSLSVMKSGEVIEQGDLQEIFDDPQNAYTQKLLLATPRIAEESA